VVLVMVMSELPLLAIVVADVRNVGREVVSRRHNMW